MRRASTRSPVPLDVDFDLFYAPVKAGRNLEKSRWIRRQRMDFYEGDGWSWKYPARADSASLPMQRFAGKNARICRYAEK